MTSSRKQALDQKASTADWARSAKMNRWLLDCLDAVTNLLRPPGSIPHNGGPDPVYVTTAAAIKRVVEFRSLGFWIVDQNTHEFLPVYLEPEIDREDLLREFELQIDEGNFAWAIRHNSPVVVPTETGGRVLLHVLATQSTVVGMFMGIPHPRHSFLPQASQKFLSIMLSYCASVLETRALHEELNEHTKNLEQLVEQRTVELRQSIAEAQQASKVKGEFLAMMSHEIRTPLNGVTGMTELLLDTALSDEQREFVQTVRSSSEALLTIINDILDFSKIEANKLSLDEIEFDLRNTVEEALELVAPQASRKGLQLTLLASPSIPLRAVTDPGRFRQVLLNLLSNAIKFTDRGEVVVRMHVVKQTRSHTLLGVDVSDSGIGIPPERQKQLFQPFVQVDSSSKRRYGGTGLGLVISRRLVNMMGGNIGVRSVEGRGSTFWFTIRVANCESNSEEDPTTAIDLRGTRALVAESHPASRQMFKQQLESWNVVVETAETAEEALALLTAKPRGKNAFGFVLLDRDLPGMDGLELAKRLSETAGSHYPPLVLVTSTGERGDASEVRAAGFAGYLPKPIRQSTLQRCILTVLGNEGKKAEQKVAPLVTRHSIAEGKARTRARVLVAEDNVVNQKVVVNILKKLGCRVDVVGNGIEAVAAHGRTTYDIVFMDCQMPEMDGYEATAEIRRHEAAKDGDAEDFRTPIVAVTANAMPGDRQKCIEAGMDDYVAKPFRKPDLDRALSRWVGGTGITEAPTLEFPRATGTDN